MRSITNKHRGRRLAVFGVIACTAGLLAGCGGSTSRRTTITTSTAQAGQHTAVTTSTAQTGQHSAVKTCGTSQGCDNRPHRPAVIDCEGGVTTNYSCVFADLVRYVRPRKSGLIAIRDPNGSTTPVECTVTESFWICRSRVSPVWARGTGH